MVSPLPDLPPPISFLCILAILVVYIMCCYLLIDFISQHEQDHTGSAQESHELDEESSSYLLLSVEELQKMTYLYRKVGSNCSTCTICLENLEHAQVCRVIPDCHHEFHAGCIDPWLSTSLTCPTCRARFRFRHSM